MKNSFLIILCSMLVYVFIKVFEVYKRKSTLQEFFLLDGNLQPGAFIGTMVSTNLSLGNFLYLSAIWAYFYGISGILWITIGILIMLISFKFFGKKYKNYIENRDNTGTLHEYLSNSYPKASLGVNKNALRYLASISTITSLALAITLELHLASNIIAVIIDKDPWILFIICSAIACFVAAIGGFWGVKVTDIFQSFLLYASLIFLFILIYIDDSQAKNYTTVYSFSITNLAFDVGWWNIISIIVFGIGWPLVTMDTWQRNSASRSLPVAMKGILISGGLMALAAIGWSMVGLYDHLALSNLSGSSGGYDPFVDFFLINKDSLLVKLSLSFFATGLIMAALSTADTFFVVCGHSIISDLIVGIYLKSKYSDLSSDKSKMLTDISRVIIMMLWFLIILVWFVLKNLNILQSALSLFFVAYGVQYCLLIPIIVSGYTKKKDTGPAFWSIAAGLIISIFVGISSSLALQYGWSTPLSLSADQWLSLTPVVTVAASAVVFFACQVGVKND